MLLVFHVMNLLVKFHVKCLIFKTNEQLVEYLIKIARLTFEMRP